LSSLILDFPARFDSDQPLLAALKPPSLIAENGKLKNGKLRADR